MSNSKKYTAQLRRCLAPAQSVLILTHDYPDPDSLASAFGLRHLLQFWGVKRVDIAYNGFIGRAENKAMVSLVSIPLVLHAKIDADAYDRVVLVDCSPGSGNISLPPGLQVDAVIDHHPGRSSHAGQCLHQVTADAAATSVLVTEHLRNSGCPIPAPLATALYYGIKTDIKGMSESISRQTAEISRLLLEMMDYRILWNIENPTRAADYFRCFRCALNSAVIYGKVGYVEIGTLKTPENVAEIADFFSHLETLEWVVCAGASGRSIFFSIRSRHAPRAGEMAQRLARALHGNGGGHGHSAAGRIPLAPKDRLKPFNAFKREFLHTFRLRTVKPLKRI